MNYDKLCVVQIVKKQAKFISRSNSCTDIVHMFHILNLSFFIYHECNIYYNYLLIYNSSQQKN